MTNIFFEDETITADDLFFVCSMIERVARHLKQPNRYVVNKMGHYELARQLSLAQVVHSENPLDVVDRWTEEYGLEPGSYDVADVDPELCEQIPTAHDMGKVYARLILQTRLDAEDYADGILRVYNDHICQTIDNYNCSAYYEPSYYLARCYFAGVFI